MATKKVKVKIAKKKINIKNITIAIFLVATIIYAVTYIINYPIKNIYIQGNNIVSDKTIIELANIEKYPSFIKSYFTNIEKKIETNDYIKKSIVKRPNFGKINIEIEEEKPLFIYQEKLVLSSGKKLDNIYNIDYVPYIKNNISDIYEKAIEKFSLLNEEILIKISEISYEPNEIDKERFLLTMIDNNYVYITLSRIEKVNKYNSIINELSGKKGIIYLDSGDYVEIKDWHTKIDII